ncbi:MAG TPA: amino acid synthesis family protein [SAR324 cluster bacterium]|nr:amino acid synthesis family protein [SAR324 cluster bacterium]
MKLELKIRRLVIQLDEIHLEMGKTIDPPAQKALAAGVFQNPYAGRYVEDLEPMYYLGAEIGGLLARKVVEALGVEPGSITSYGKGAVIGVGGEIEHAAAILHPRFGKPVREAVEKGDDIIPSTKKMGGPGSVLVLPITNKDSIWSFDHMDAMEISIPDAPREDEMLVAVAVANSGRPLARTKV